MSGGISAIKGFDYQATVILDRLFDLFDQHGSTAFVRPEGEDDLDLCWTDNSVEYRQYIQIKKPTETNNGVLNPTTWTLTNAINDLFPNAILHLANNNYEQIWILGDEISNDLRELINAGDRAPLDKSLSYLTVIHKIVKYRCLNEFKLSKKNKEKIQRWKIPTNIDPNLSIEQKLECFSVFSTTLNVPKRFLQQYVQEITEINALLPDILNHIQILSLYGTESEIVGRVYQRLEDSYHLPRAVIENTLFRNLRGFINDISKQPGKTFNKEDFELELRTVWPTMVAIKEPPVLDIQFIRRTDLVAQITQDFTGKAIEITGVSGSGKTSLASETLEYIRSNQLDRTVLYAEVTDDIPLRDVLAGVAYHLRRQGIITPFNIAIDRHSATERVLKDLAKCLSSCGLRILLLIDLVHGNCTDSFAKDLNHFISSVSDSHLQIAIFSQEMPLREMNSPTKTQHKISQLNIPGFKFEEFAQLVTYQHKDVDRSVLWGVYQRITAGRETGLLASLAYTLAHVETIQDMRIIAEMPADEMLAEAERKRFLRITPSVRTAAKKITCFALPFSKTEASNIFSTEDADEAIHELMVLGLLRKTGDDLYEMHETVRAGLESFISLDLRQGTHEQLAEWYAKNGNVTAQIFHLEKAGNSAKAHILAKEAFLEGKATLSLEAYILKNSLVTEGDILNLFSNPEIKITDHYIFPFIALRVGSTNLVGQLLELINSQIGRFQQDFHWSTSVMRIVLELDNTKLLDLVALAIQTQETGNPLNSALDWVSLAAQNAHVSIESNILTLFANAEVETKRKLISILLLDWRRDTLKPVLIFLNSHPEMLRSDSRSKNKIHIYKKIDDCEKTIEFLAAFPLVEINKILLSKSACLGTFEEFIWSRKDDLRKQIIEIMKQSEVEEIIAINALRVLIFLAEPTLPELCTPFLKRNDTVKALASLVPTILPSLFDKTHYETEMFDVSLPLDARLTALSILSALDSNVSELYKKINETEEQKNLPAWHFWFLMNSVFYPFPEAIPLLTTQLASNQNTDLFAGIFVKIAEWSIPETVPLLIENLSHPNALIRLNAAAILGRKRSCLALTSLIQQLAKEDDEKIAVTLITSILSSGATSTSDISTNKFSSPTIDLWSCILAMRTRDFNYSEKIISLACDKTQHWQIRRTAILAAGCFPFELILKRIMFNVLDEYSSLTIDQNDSLLCHLTVSHHLLNSGRDIIMSFIRGKEFFLSVWGYVFEEEWKECISNYNLPSGNAVAEWLFNRLSTFNLQKDEPLDKIINELHVPILHAAALRSLRLCNKADLIETYLTKSSHVWFAIRCLHELHMLKRPDIYNLEKILNLVSLTPWSDHPILKIVISNLFQKTKEYTKVLTNNFAKGTLLNPQTPVVCLDYNGVLEALEQPDLILGKDFYITHLTQENIKALTRLLDPSNRQSSSFIESIKPALNFTSFGHTVTQRTSTSGVKSNLMQIQNLLRPAIAAANRFEIIIPWHEASINGTFYDKDLYIHNYIKFLGLQDDSVHFYNILTCHKKLLIPYICKFSDSRSILKYLDDRIVPFILPISLSGNDEFFEGLCMLSAEIVTESIDSTLKALFFRLMQFLTIQTGNETNRSIHMWRGFKYITSHPRFEFIPNWSDELSTVLQTNLSWFDKQDILHVLERSPASYLIFEQQLFKTSNFERDEVDKLNDAAEKLFHELN